MSEQQLGTFQLVNLSGSGTVEFIYFPPRIGINNRANWNGQDVTTGVKPLFYSNREPRRVRVDELYLVRVDENVSISDDLDLLFELQEETKAGTPPALLAVWGDRQARVVLEELDIEQQFFTPDGSPTRARISLTLLQVQEEK